MVALRRGSTQAFASLCLIAVLLQASCFQSAYSNTHRERAWQKSKPLDGEKQMFVCCERMIIQPEWYLLRIDSWPEQVEYVYVDGHLASIAEENLDNVSMFWLPGKSGRDDQWKLRLQFPTAIIDMNLSSRDSVCPRDEENKLNKVSWTTDEDRNIIRTTPPKLKPPVKGSSSGRQELHEDYTNVTFKPPFEKQKSPLNSTTTRSSRVKEDIEVGADDTTDNLLVIGVPHDSDEDLDTAPTPAPTPRTTVFSLITTIDDPYSQSESSEDSTSSSSYYDARDANSTNSPSNTIPVTYDPTPYPSESSNSSLEDAIEVSNEKAEVFRAPMAIGAVSLAIIGAVGVIIGARAKQGQRRNVRMRAMSSIAAAAVAASGPQPVMRAPLVERSAPSEASSLSISDVFRDSEIA